MKALQSVPNELNNIAAKRLSPKSKIKLDIAVKIFYNYCVRDSQTVAWGNSRGKSERRRARAQANGLLRRLKGKCNRNIPQRATAVRVEMQGKSLQTLWRQSVPVNPARRKK